jgi:hypothetical protein
VKTIEQWQAEERAMDDELARIGKARRHEEQNSRESDSYDHLAADVAREEREEREANEQNSSERGDTPQNAPAPLTAAKPPGTTTPRR